MTIYEKKLKKLHGYEEGKADAIDSESSAKALGYKKNFLKNFISINQNQIDTRLGGERFYVTRKYDGEYAIILYQNGQTVTVNRSGRVRRGIPCIEEAGRLLQQAGYRQAIVPAEIYVYDPQRKTRVNDLLSALADSSKIDTLRLAVFDLLELDDKPVNENRYERKWQKMNAIFANGTLCHTVDLEVVDSVEKVKSLFDKWVGREGSEGLVVHTELPFVYKIKPRHNIDVVVIGFSEGTGAEKGMVRSLLTAFMPAEGLYQIVGRVGSGLNQKLGRELFAHFSERVVPSEYIETDTNYVAFRMVDPDTVIEVSVNDLLWDTVNGPKINPVIEIRQGEFRLHSTVEGAKFLAPVFVRVRDDKSADPQDVRPSQTESFSYRTETVVTDFEQKFPASELMVREVYGKNLGTKRMLQKYLVWKTNKEQTGLFPGYVLHITNFSSERLEPLQREVRISDSREQIMELYREALQANIKKGWEKIETGQKTSENRLRISKKATANNPPAGKTQKSSPRNSTVKSPSLKNPAPEKKAALTSNNEASLTQKPGKKQTTLTSGSVGKKPAKGKK